MTYMKHNGSVAENIIDFDEYSAMSELKRANNKATSCWDESYPVDLRLPIIRERLASMEASMATFEKVLYGKSLKTIRPRVEVKKNTKKVSFEQLQNCIKNLSDDFKNLKIRLNNFIDLKRSLADLNLEARKWDDKYLLRSIIIFYDSIKHAYSEELNKKQLKTIKEVGNLISKGTIDRAKYREAYKSLRSAGFRIIPEPSPVENHG